MSVCSPGPSAAVSLLQTAKKRNINFCLICQKLKDSSGSHKLTSTPDGRSKVVQTSKLLNNDFLHNLDASDFSNIQYHVNTCYARYIKTGIRHAQKKAAEKRSSSESKVDGNEMSTPENRIKRKKSTEGVDIKNKPCIICNKINHKHKNVTVSRGVNETDAVKQLEYIQQW